MKRRSFKCPCEGCKTAREQRSRKWRLEQAAYIEERAVELAAEIMRKDAPAARIGRNVIERTRQHLHAKWKSQDGSEISVQGMGLAHLFFALAKGYRGEYGHGSVQGRMGALESEALRRLSKAHFPQSYHEPHPNGKYYPLRSENDNGLADSAANDALAWGR